MPWRPFVLLSFLISSYSFAGEKKVDLGPTITKAILSDKRLHNSAYFVGTWQGWTALVMEVECAGKNNEDFRFEQNVKNESFRCFTRAIHFSRYPQLLAIELINFQVKAALLKAMIANEFLENIHSDYFYSANVRCNIPTGTSGQASCEMFRQMD